MSKKTYKETDEAAAAIEAGREKARFSYIRETIKELRKSNLPVYYDILYKHLSRGGISLIREYTERFAKENYMSLKNDEEARVLYNKFHMLYDPYYRFTYNKNFLILHDDGSFELDKKAVDKHFEELYTYEITAEQYEAVEAILKGFNTLKAHPNYITSCFYKEGEETKLNRTKLYALVTGGRRSVYTM